MPGPIHAGTAEKFCTKVKNNGNSFKQTASKDKRPKLSNTRRAFDRKNLKSVETCSKT